MPELAPSPLQSAAGSPDSALRAYLNAKWGPDSVAAQLYTDAIFNPAAEHRHGGALADTGFHQLSCATTGDARARSALQLRRGDANVLFGLDVLAHAELCVVCCGAGVTV